MPSTSRPSSHSPLPPRFNGRKTGGFSLVELLTVLTIVGILAAVVIPMITGISGDADETRHRRNAQNLANVFSTGEIAGARFLVPGNLERTISKVATGTTIDHGVFSGHLFSVPGLSTEDRAAAARYLVLEQNHLAYNPGA
jgi:prepilin-type N-terminal cleavage/methylation domain-containing protein